MGEFVALLVEEDLVYDSSRLSRRWPCRIYFLFA